MEQFIAVLVGNIGTGKTSFAKKAFSNDEVVIHIDELEKGIAADEKVIPLLHSSLKSKRSVIIDGTNFRISHRKKYIQFGRLYYCKIIAYNFGSGSPDSLQRRISTSKSKTEDEWITSHVGIKSNFQSPTIEEGFHEIFDVSDSLSLK